MNWIDDLSQKWKLRVVFWIGEIIPKIKSKNWITVHLVNLGIDQGLELVIAAFKRPEFSGKEKVLIFVPSTFPRTKKELIGLEQIKQKGLLQGITVILVDFPTGQTQKQRI